MKNSFIFLCFSRRFCFLKRIMRFDDKSTRQAHLDRFAAFREIFTMFDLNCQSHWTLSLDVTIDETLRRFFGRCSFRCLRRTKYGLLLRVLADSDYTYIYKSIPYAGVPIGLSPEEERAHVRKNKPYDLVHDLTQDIHGSGRNVTMDR